MMTMARTESSYGAEKLSPRQKTWISAAEILCPRQKNGSSDAEIGISRQKTCSSDAEIGISGQKACSSAAVKHRPRLRTRIYATEIGIRRGFSNTNYHELFINFSDSRLYDELHGNYMFYLNTNYHELTTNFSLMIINGQLMVIIC